MASRETSLAIVFAGGLVGLGLFFGLRSRTTDPSGVSPAATLPAAAGSLPAVAGSLPAVAGSPPAVAGSPPAVAGSQAVVGDGTEVAREALPGTPEYAALQARVSGQVREALERQRPPLGERCWKAEKLEPDATLTLRFVFAPDGSRSVFGAMVRGAPERVAECLRRNPPAITVPSPGARVGVQVEMKLERR